MVEPDSVRLYFAFHCRKHSFDVRRIDCLSMWSHVKRHRDSWICNFCTHLTTVHMDGISCPMLLQVTRVEVCAEFSHCYRDVVSLHCSSSNGHLGACSKNGSIPTDLILTKFRAEIKKQNTLVSIADFLMHQKSTEAGFFILLDNLNSSYS